MKPECRCLLAVLTALGSLWLGAGSAAAAPVFNLDAHHAETNFPPGGTGQYWFDVNNVGDDPTSGSITLTVNLPSGITRQAVAVQTLEGAGTLNWSCPGSPGQTTITCTTVDTLARHALSQQVFLTVNIAPAASGDRFLSARVSGGGASVAPPAAACPPGAAACTVERTHIEATPASFGIVDSTFRADFFDADGVTPARQSGAHPDLATFAFDFNSIVPDPGQPSKRAPADSVRNLSVDLPPGFLGDPTAVGECTQVQLTISQCPPSSQVGRIDVRTTDPFLTLGVFNMTHPKGVISDLAFVLFGNPIHIRASLDPARNYAIKTTVSDINETLPVFDQKLTIWGVPADPAHDSERCLAFSSGFGGDTAGECEAGIPPKPFLTVPFDCTTANQMKLSRYDSWQNTGVFGPDVLYDLPGQFGGCDQTQAEFEPEVSIVPTSSRADSPTGLNVTATVPFNDDPDGLATPPVKRLQVTLPEGMSLNPSFADGLDGCTEAEIGISHAGVPDEQKVTCPDRARVGAVELSTPLFPDPSSFPPNCPGTEPLQGSIYLAKQQANPLDSLFAIYTVLHDCEERGVLVKIPGRLDLDPSTGRVTTTFDDLPQFPFDALSVQFRSGDRAPLINPPTCGTKTIEGTLNTWVQPGKEVPVDSSYQVTEGPNGGGCSADPAARPFAPVLRAGAQDPVAGAFSPFVLRLTRQDGEQEVTGLEADLPPGLSGRLAGVAECSESTLASIPTAPGTGAAEKASPSCPAASRVGRVNAGSGAGPLPFYISGSAYLAGPYKGAPLSLAVVTPAVAGGIDLGNVVVRTALRVDPDDAQIHAVSDPIPAILHGVPIHLRDVRVIVDRSDFSLNPTSCDEKPITGRANGAGAMIADPADDSSAGLTDRFQVGGCAELGFKPKLTFRLKGGTRRGAFPSFSAHLVARPGDANIARTTVVLPHSTFIEQAHIRTVCTRVQFAQSACPAGSIYGKAKATSPLFDEALEGPVYLRSNGGERLLPDLVISLNGKVDVVLTGFVDSVNERVRNTFDVIPDAPVTEFELSLLGGNRGLLVNSRDLCLAPSRATVRLVGQNGKRYDTRPALGTSCRKGSRAKAKRGSRGRR